jgi:hypothetical protein
MDTTIAVAVRFVHLFFFVGKIVPDGEPIIQRAVKQLVHARQPRLGRRELRRDPHVVRLVERMAVNARVTLIRIADV